MFSTSTIVLILVVIFFAGLIYIFAKAIWNHLSPKPEPEPPKQNTYPGGSEKLKEYIKTQEEEALKKRRELAAQARVVTPTKVKTVTSAGPTTNWEELEKEKKKGIRESSSDYSRSNNGVMSTEDGVYIYTPPAEDYSSGGYSHHSDSHHSDFGGGDFGGGGAGGDYSSGDSSCSSSSCSSSSGSSSSCSSSSCSSSSGSSCSSCGGGGD